MDQSSTMMILKFFIKECFAIFNNLICHLLRTREAKFSDYFKFFPLNMELAFRIQIEIVEISNFC